MTGQNPPRERVDELTPRGLKILQREDGFRYGTDAILLAHFAGAKGRETLVDMGTGTGIMALIMALDRGDLDWRNNVRKKGIDRR